jgi:hypothetical protein
VAVTARGAKRSTAPRVKVVGGLGAKAPERARARSCGAKRSRCAAGHPTHTATSQRGKSASVRRVHEQRLCLYWSGCLAGVSLAGQAVSARRCAAPFRGVTCPWSADAEGSEKTANPKKVFRHTRTSPLTVPEPPHSRPGSRRGSRAASGSQRAAKQGRNRGANQGRNPGSKPARESQRIGGGSRIGKQGGIGTTKPVKERTLRL